MADRILAETKFLRFVERDGWSFVTRAKASGVITVVALTDDGKLVLVEQPRRPLGCTVIELPAGLAGDEAGTENEALVEAARRELFEETGYEATSIEALVDCASSPGLTNEIVTFFLAKGLRKQGSGGGTPGEDIVVHEIPFADVLPWLQARAAAGTPVAAKVYAGLFFAARVLGMP